MFQPAGGVGAKPPTTGGIFNFPAASQAGGTGLGMAGGATGGAAGGLTLGAAPAAGGGLGKAKKIQFLLLSATE